MSQIIKGRFSLKKKITPREARPFHVLGLSPLPRKKPPTYFCPNDYFVLSKSLNMVKNIFWWEVSRFLTNIFVWFLSELFFPIFDQFSSRILSSDQQLVKIIFIEIREATKITLWSLYVRLSLILVFAAFLREAGKKVLLLMARIDIDIDR